MTIEKIEMVNTKKKRLILDDGQSFALYNGEIYRYKLKEGTSLPEEQYREILDTVLTKRAGERMMHLLKNRDYTEYQMRQKLKQGFYPEEVIEKVVCIGRRQRYLDDRRYARVYIEQKSKQMSRRMLSVKLSEKGISREIIEQALSEGVQDEENALDAMIRKKNVDFSRLDWKERQKICAYFMRKGFTYENISKKINEIAGTDYLT